MFMIFTFNKKKINFFSKLLALWANTIQLLMVVINAISCGKLECFVVSVTSTLIWYLRVRLLGRLQRSGMFKSV